MGKSDMGFEFFGRRQDDSQLELESMTSLNEIDRSALCMREGGENSKFIYIVCGSPNPVILRAFRITCKISQAPTGREGLDCLQTFVAGKRKACDTAQRPLEGALHGNFI